MICRSNLWDQLTPNLHLKFRCWTQIWWFKKSFVRPPRYPRNKARDRWSCWSPRHPGVSMLGSLGLVWSIHSPPLCIGPVCDSDLTLTFHESQTSTFVHASHTSTSTACFRLVSNWVKLLTGLTGRTPLNRAGLGCWTKTDTFHSELLISLSVVWRTISLSHDESRAWSNCDVDHSPPTAPAHHQCNLQTLASRLAFEANNCAKISD